MRDRYFSALWLCGICLFVFFVFQKWFGLTEALLLIQNQAPYQPWRYVTALFTHANIGHLLSNLFALGLFGSILEGRIGSKRLVALFLGAGIVINLIPFYARSLGASGAIFALIGCLIMLRPTMVIWLNGLPMPMAVAGVLWGVQDLIGVFVPDDVANLAHLSGLGLGLIMQIRRIGREGYRKRYRKKWMKR